MHANSKKRAIRQWERKKKYNRQRLWLHLTRTYWNILSIHCLLFALNKTLEEKSLRLLMPVAWCISCIQEWKSLKSQDIKVCDKRVHSATMAKDSDTNLGYIIVIGLIQLLGELWRPFSSCFNLFLTSQCNIILGQFLYPCVYIDGWDKNIKPSQSPIDWFLRLKLLSLI